MDGQLSFATLDYAGKKKRTNGDVFLAEMAAVPWQVLEAVIAPHYRRKHEFTRPLVHFGRRLTGGR
jgi:IS5 family transposase